MFDYELTFISGGNCTISIDDVVISPGRALTDSHLYHLGNVGSDLVLGCFSFGEPTEEEENADSNATGTVHLKLGVYVKRGDITSFPEDAELVFVDGLIFGVPGLDAVSRLCPRTDLALSKDDVEVVRSVDESGSTVRITGTARPTMSCS